MNDPHVDELHYELRTLPFVKFADPPPLEHDHQGFTLGLSDGRLLVRLKNHFATVAEARACVEPFLDTWTLHEALRRSNRNVWFEYLTATMIDRRPGPGNVGALHGTVASIKVTASGELTATFSTYPAPPTRFNATPLVDALFHLYRAAVEQRRMASAAAYFALTAIKTRLRREDGPKNGRQRSNLAADALGVERVIFDKLHELSTDAGDITTGRKVSDPAELEQPRRPHSGAELNWMCEAIRLLALRLGEWEADPSGTLPLLKLTDLPTLDAT